MSQTIHDAKMTPAGLQRTTVLARRRIAAAFLNIATYLALLYWLGTILGDQGWSLIDGLIFLCFAIAAPWSVLGVWNALLGLWLLHLRRDSRKLVAPYAEAGDQLVPLQSRTAITMTLRNEDPARAYARLETLMLSLEKTGEDLFFSFFILSDTNDARVALEEERRFEDLKTRYPRFASRIHYRRRDTNEGFKAGNIRDFCERYGADFEFMLPLDADSLMSGNTIRSMVRMAQAYPKLGILQSLVVGAPTQSGFARIFQFGMRHGMRPYTMGSAWWAGDCGPFWGHNALVRIAPFRDECHLPVLPGGPPLGGQILSHDQVEAVLMRRAGYECRVLPEESGSFEDNPPTLLEFTRRDLRWCQGNMQYWRLLDMKGIEPMSRFQLVWAIMMFVGVPAFTLILLLAALKPLDGEDLTRFPSQSAIAFYLTFLALYLAPKLAGFLDIAFTRGALARYGGALRFFSSALLEVLFSFMLGASTTLRTGIFIIGLAFGHSVVWSGQSRDAHQLTLEEALAGLWPQMVFGGLLFAIAAELAPQLILWSLPLTLGYVLAAPFAVFTSGPAFGAFLKKTGLCAIPEDLAPPPVLTTLESVAAANEASLQRKLDAT